MKLVEINNELVSEFLYCKFTPLCKITVIVFTNVLEVNATVNGVPSEFWKGYMLVVGSIFQDKQNCRSYHENNC